MTGPMADALLWAIVAAQVALGVWLAVEVVRARRRRRPQPPPAWPYLWNRRGGRPGGLPTVVDSDVPAGGRGGVEP